MKIVFGFNFIINGSKFLVELKLCRFSLKLIYALQFEFLAKIAALNFCLSYLLRQNMFVLVAFFFFSNGNE